MEHALLVSPHGRTGSEEDVFASPGYGLALVGLSLLNVSLITFPEVCHEQVLTLCLPH